MDLQQRGGDSASLHDEGDQLQELPFTPVHAPVITLGMNVPRWAQSVVCLRHEQWCDPERKDSFKKKKLLDINNNFYKSLKIPNLCNVQFSLPKAILR